MRRKLSGFDGVDLDEYNRLRSRKEEIDGWSPDSDEGAKAKLEEINSNWQRKYDADVGKEREARTQAEARLQRTLKRNAATAAISKHAPKGVKALLPHVEQYLGVGQLASHQRDELGRGVRHEDLVGIHPSQLFDERARQSSGIGAGLQRRQLGGAQVSGRRVENRETALATLATQVIASSLRTGS